MIKLEQLFLISLTSLFLSACGGGGGGSSGSSGSSVATTCSTSTSSFCTSEFNANYGLVTTKAYEAFDDGYDGDGIKVAVLDGGFDTSHADLDANIITGYDEEDDNNTPNADSHNTTMAGHGTHVAGIIAAEKNGTGMMGIAYNASIMPIKVFKDNGDFVSGGIQNSIDYATDNDAISLNNSWGSRRTASGTCNGESCYIFLPAESTTGGFSSAERTAWASVATDNNVVVFAAGNDGNNSATGLIPRYRSSDNAFLYNLTAAETVSNGWTSYSNRSSQEAQYAANVSDVADNWLNVVAVDNTNTIATYSNGCGNTKAYCIAAPGSSIYSTLPTDLAASGYGTYNGTSMAAPHVSGAIAVMKEKWPNLTGAQIVDLIISSATDLGDSGVDEVYGVGMLNMAGAMTATTAQSFSYVDSNGDLKKISKEGSRIKTSSILSNLSSGNAAIGFVDSYDRVYSNRSTQFNSLKSDRLTDEQNFFKFRNGFTDANLINKKLNLNFGFADYGNNQNNFDLKHRSYPFQVDEYQDIFLGDDIMSLGFLTNQTSLLSNLLDNNNNFLIKTNFSKIKKNSINSLSVGFGYEQNTILNSEFSGAFETKNNTTFYANFIRDQRLTEKDNLYFKLGYGHTKSNFENEEFFHLSDLVTSTAAIGYVHSEKTNKFALSVEAPLSVMSGSAKYYSVSGYDNDGNYKNGSNSIDLKPYKQEFKLSVYYDKSIDENTNYGIELYQSNMGNNNIQVIYSKSF